jgi:hypothetical protein
MTYLTKIRFKLFFSSGDMITVFSREEAIKEINERINSLQDFVTQIIEYKGNESITYKALYSTELRWIEYTEEGKTYSL